jgi:chemotaxis signal transduction protein
MSFTANAPALPNAGQSGAQYSLFRRHNQSFCLDVTHLQEVLQTSHVSPVPKSHPCVAGVMNLRGDVLPVLLVDSWLRLPEQPYDPARPIIVLRRKELLVGIQVDSVQRVGFVPRTEVLPTPLQNQAPYWAGIWFRQDQELSTLLDGGALLDSIHSAITGSTQTTPSETAPTSA